MTMAAVPTLLAHAMYAAQGARLTPSILELSDSERQRVVASIRELQAVVASVQLQLVALSTHVLQQLHGLEHTVSYPPQHVDGTAHGQQDREETGEEIHRPSEREEDAVEEDAESDRERERREADSQREIARRVLFGTGPHRVDDAEDQSEDEYETERSRSSSEHVERAVGGRFRLNREAPPSRRTARGRYDSMRRSPPRSASVRHDVDAREDHATIDRIDRYRRIAPTPGEAAVVEEPPRQAPSHPRRYVPRCSVDGCISFPRAGGKCVRHGGGLCSVDSCTKSAQRGGKCIRHGGGPRCSEEGCTKGARSDGKCVRHGGGLRCTEDGCRKNALRGGKCVLHGGGVH